MWTESGKLCEAMLRARLSWPWISSSRVKTVYFHEENSRSSSAWSRHRCGTENVGGVRVGTFQRRSLSLRVGFDVVDDTSSAARSPLWRVRRVTKVMAGVSNTSTVGA